MRCTKCGTESTTGKKFCAACGSPLSSRCPKCGAENAPSSAFCEDCGSALVGNAALAAPGSSQTTSTAPEIRVTPEQPDASTVIDGERKTVTVADRASTLVNNVKNDDVRLLAPHQTQELR